MPYKAHTVAAIVPAYNEKAYIENVVSSLLSGSVIDDVIIIDDCSTDDTWSLLVPFAQKITLLRNDKRRGKGFSVACGIEQTSADIVLFLDADVVDYNDCDLSKLLAPVLDGDADACYRYSDDGIFDPLTGIRCYRRSDVAPLISAMKETTRYYPQRGIGAQTTIPLPNGGL